MESPHLIYGIRPVAEAIETDRPIERIFIRKGASGPLVGELRDRIARHRLPLQEVPEEKLDRLTRGNHQGVVALIAPIRYAEFDTLLERVPSDETPLFVLLDSITDVHNFGAIARSAECAGAHGIIVPQKNGAPVNADAVRISAGALLRIPVARVGSLRNALHTLQAEGLQAVALTEKGSTVIYDTDLGRPTVLVLGNEERGISREVVRLCDVEATIPMVGAIASLNVSAATAVALFESVRQRIH